MPFTFAPTSLPGVTLITPHVFPDPRGFFIETYRLDDFRRAGIADTFVQDNHSRSTRGVVRGLHYQKAPAAQGKLLRAIVGEIFDVAADIRRGSPTFGRWLGVRLSAENRLMLYVPPGFAHGFAVLSDVAEIEYKVTTPYSPEHERSLLWNDPALGIEWPVADPILSDRDRRAPLLRDADINFT
jgi:dTDP-4-dehydrorhamnose 3,5-epimerase